MVYLKNIYKFKKLTMKKFIVLFVVAFSFFGCENETVSNPNLQTNSKKELAQLKQKAIVPILTMAKNKEFKEFVLNECLKQEQGEYNVYFSKIIKEYKDNPSYSGPIMELIILSNKIKSLNGGIEPLIFYPRAETIEDGNSVTINQKNSKTSKLAADPIGVNQDVFYPDNSSPGYILTFDGELIFYANIVENYAWENDVWVIGEEEVVPNMSSFGDEILTSLVLGAPSSRFDGQAEYGGIVQVTDLGAIEPWTAGKLEFSIIVRGINGIELKKDFDKRKRSHFRGGKWYDYGYFIGNWNNTAFGNLMVEKWMELDGGNSASVTLTIPPAVPGGITTSVTIPSKNRDDDLGQSIVQFTDSMDQIYNLSHINIKRKHL